MIKAHTQYMSMSVNVYSSIMNDSVIELHLRDGTLTGQRYLELLSKDLTLALCVMFLMESNHPNINKMARTYTLVFTRTIKESMD